MQARGRYDFNATANDELSFQKSAVLKILNMEEDMNWFKAELKGVEGYVPKTYIEMAPHPWFYGSISRVEAEKILLQKDPSRVQQPDGAFLVRMCESSPGDFSLSVKCQDQAQHFKVLREGTSKYYLWADKFDSINELVEYHRTTSINRGQRLLLKDLVSEQTAAYVKDINNKNTQRTLPLNSQPQQIISPGTSNDGQIYVAAYDFAPQEEVEIELKRGERVRVLDKSDINWWKGEVRGNVGLFPATYVRPL